MSESKSDALPSWLYRSVVAYIPLKIRAAYLGKGTCTYTDTDNFNISMLDDKIYASVSNIDYAEYKICMRSRLH